MKWYVSLTKLDWTNTVASLGHYSQYTVIGKDDKVYVLVTLNVSKLSIIKWVTWNKSSLLLTIDLQNTQTLQLN